MTTCGHETSLKREDAKLLESEDTAAHGMGVNIGSRLVNILPRFWASEWGGSDRQTDRQADREKTLNFPL